MAKKTIKPSQLQIGMYVQLDLSWMRHDFLSNNFKIKNEKQLDELRNLGLDEIIYDPERSDVQPLLQEQSETPSAAPAVEDEAETGEQQQRLARIEKLKQRQLSLGRCEKAYQHAAGSVRKVMGHLMSQPAAAVEAAEEMVGGMVDSLMMDQEATLQLVSIKGKSESSYFHAINVTILSLMLGRHMKLNAEQMRHLGVGALFHDLGHNELPGRVLRPPGALNKAEQQLYQMHPLYGVKMAQKLGTLSSEAISIIAQHHEMADGSGYPKKLKAAEIGLLSKIVAIVNSYDNLCNDIQAEKSFSPYEAMSHMYAKQKAKYDPKILSLFITNMGVYPPGTVVRLADGRIAAVISINPKALLLPNVMIYAPEIPRKEAPILDLAEEQLTIKESLRRSALMPEVLEYLNLGDSVNYFIDADKPAG